MTQTRWVTLTFDLESKGNGMDGEWTGNGMDLAFRSAIR